MILFCTQYGILNLLDNEMQFTKSIKSFSWKTFKSKENILSTIYICVTFWTKCTYFFKFYTNLWVSYSITIYYYIINDDRVKIWEHFRLLIIKI